MFHSWTCRIKVFLLRSWKHLKVSGSWWYNTMVYQTSNSSRPSSDQGNCSTYLPDRKKLSTCRKTGVILARGRKLSIKEIKRMKRKNHLILGTLIYPVSSNIIPKRKKRFPFCGNFISNCFRQVKEFFQLLRKGLACKRDISPQSAAAKSIVEPWGSSITPRWA